MFRRCVAIVFAFTSIDNTGLTDSSKLHTHYLGCPWSSLDLQQPGPVAQPDASPIGNQGNAGSIRRSDSILGSVETDMTSFENHSLSSNDSRKAAVC